MRDDNPHDNDDDPFDDLLDALDEMAGGLDPDPDTTNAVRIFNSGSDGAPASRPTDVEYVTECGIGIVSGGMVVFDLNGSHFAMTGADAAKLADNLADVATASAATLVERNEPHATSETTSTDATDAATTTDATTDAGRDADDERGGTDDASDDDDDDDDGMTGIDIQTDGGVGPVEQAVRAGYADEAGEAALAAYAEDADTLDGQHLPDVITAAIEATIERLESTGRL